MDLKDRTEWILEGNLTEADVSRRKQVLQTFAPRVWPAPHSGEELAVARQTGRETDRQEGPRGALVHLQRGVGVVITFSS